MRCMQEKEVEGSVITVQVTVSSYYCINLDTFLKIRTRKHNHLPKFQGWGSGLFLLC